MSHRFLLNPVIRSPDAVDRGRRRSRRRPGPATVTAFRCAGQSTISKGEGKTRCAALLCRACEREVAVHRLAAEERQDDLRVGDRLRLDREEIAVEDDEIRELARLD